jgi:antitoxin MazE
MITKIQKWGNSLGLRIPKALAQDAQVGPGTEVDLSVQEGRLVVRPLERCAYRLDELLGEVRPENLHGEVETGPAVGREVW